MSQSINMKSEITEKVGKSMGLWNSVINNLEEHTDLNMGELEKAFTAHDEDVCNLDMASQSSRSSYAQFKLPGTHQQSVAQSQQSMFS